MFSCARTHDPTKTLGITTQTQWGTHQ